LYSAIGVPLLERGGSALPVKRDPQAVKLVILPLDLVGKSDNDVICTLGVLVAPLGTVSRVLNGVLMLV